jgi:hypothetical protein
VRVDWATLAGPKGGRREGSACSDCGPARAVRELLSADCGIKATRQCPVDHLVATWDGHTTADEAQDLS